MVASEMDSIDLIKTDNNTEQPSPKKLVPYKPLRLKNHGDSKETYDTLHRSIPSSVC